MRGWGMAEEKTREQLLAEWWSTRPDFSWTSLVGRPIGATSGGLHGERTLQEYWRRDPQTHKQRSDDELIAAGELVTAANGELWHVVHLPLEIAGHGPTQKADLRDEVWPLIDRIVDARLRESQPTEAGGYRRVEKEGRALLQGAVLQTLPLDDPDEDPAKRRQIHIAMRHGFFAANCNFDLAIFGPSADFEDGCFARYAWFDNARFMGEAKFGNATFLGDTRFSDCVFEGETRFFKATLLHGGRFGDAKFQKRANFDRLRAHDDCDFSDALFADASFQQSEFLGGVDFTGGHIEKNAVFDQAVFTKAAWFGKREFRGAASFKSVTFADDVNFAEAGFGGAAVFRSAKFKAWTGFVKAKCLPNKPDAIAGLNFYKAEFSDVANFMDFDFSTAKELQFTSARFLGPALFSRTTWPDNSAVYAFAFTDALFTRVAYFDENDSFAAFAAFDGATFQDEVRFSQSVVETSKHLNAAVRAARAAARQDAKELIEKELESRRKENANARIFFWERGRLGKRRAQMNNRLAELQNGFRAAKHAVENRRERSAEQQFYRCELICRRKQSTTGVPERFFSLAYAAIADYGGSAMRPLVSATVLWMLCSLFFWWWGEAARGVLASHFPLDLGKPLSESVFEAAKFSAGAIFRPFGVWAEAISTNGWAGEFLNGHGAGHGLMVRIALSFQSVASLILFFLIALAVRRRFQIN